MFYEDSAINSLLNCQNCNYKYDEPYLLPCGYTICQNCSLSTDKNCSFCHQIHEVPVANYPLNQIILKLLETSPKEIYRGKEANQLKENIKIMNEKFNLLSNDVNNKEDKIKEHCIELRRQVQLKTEQTLSKINELSESLINQIDTFEKDWIENLKAKSEFNTDHFEDLKTQVTQFSSEQSKYFQRIQLDEDEMNEANELAEIYHSKIEQCLDEINVFVFNGKQFEFESSVLEMDEHFLGHFYARTFIDIKKFRTFCLNDELTDKKANSFFCVFIKPNDNYLIVYHSDSDNLVAMTVDLLLNKIEKKIICVCLETYGFERSTSFIAFNFLNEDELDTLVVLDECSNIVSKCDFNGKNVISANDEFILCVDEDENITLYDWQLNTIDTKIKFQFDDPNKAFYLPAQLIDLAKFHNRQGRFIFSYGDCLSFIDESSGMVLKTITADYLDDVYFKINADNKLMVADRSELSDQKLIAYDLNGNLSFEIKLNGFESDYRFLFASKNRIHFYDVVLNKIFYE